MNAALPVATARAVPGVAHVGELAVGVGRPYDLLTEFVRDARGTLDQELVALHSAGGRQALADALAGGTSVRLLEGAHVHFAFKQRDAVGAALRVARAMGQVEVVPYGSGKAVQHSKLAARSSSPAGDKEEAIFTNVASITDSASRRDMTVMLQGNTARAAHENIRAALAGDAGGMRLAAEQAARAGLLVQEPMAGVTLLADELERMVGSARRRIVHVGKGIDDETFARSLVAARERGVEVAVVERNMARTSAGIIREGGVAAAVGTGGTTSRLNILIADDRAVVTTAFPWSPMLGRGAGKPSRETGVVLEGPALAELERQLEVLPEGRALQAMQAAGAGQHATRGWRRMLRPARPGGPSAPLDPKEFLRLDDRRAERILVPRLT